MKKFLIFIVVFCTVFFVGCSEPKLQFARNSDGTITEIYTIPFNAQELFLHANIDYENETEKNQLQNDILGVQNSIRNYIENDIKQKVNSFILSQTASEEKVDTQTLINSVKVTKPMDGMLYNEGLVYTITFSSASIYNKFYNVNDEDIQSSLKNTNYKKGFLTNITMTEIQPYLDKTVNSGTETVLQKYREVAVDYLEPFFEKYNTQLNGVTLKEYVLANAPTKYIYQYSVPSARFKSNADTVYVSEDGYYNHVWNIPMNNQSTDNPKEIKTWYVTANRPVWYGLIFGGSLVLIGVLFGIDAINKKKSNKI